MRRLTKIKRPLNQRGVSITEYTFFLMLMVLVCIGTLVGMGVNLRCGYVDIVGSAVSAFNPTGPNSFDLDGDGDFDSADMALYQAQGCII